MTIHEKEVLRLCPNARLIEFAEGGFQVYSTSGGWLSPRCFSREAAFFNAHHEITLAKADGPK